MSAPGDLRQRIRGLPREWAQTVDERLLSLLIDRMSVPTRRTLAWLRGRRLPFHDPRRPAGEPTPSRAAVDLTADRVIARYATQASVLGLAAGMGGMASIPPEVLASAVGSYRLAQRLCVVYGFDPETDRGQMALWRALAHAYGLDLPESGLVSMRATQLPGLLVGQRAGEGRSVSGTLTRAALRSTAWRVAGRISRFIPVLAAVGQSNRERRQFRELGAEMKQVLRRLAEPSARPDDIEDAIVIDDGRS